MSATKHTSGPWTIECGKNYSNEIVGKSKTGKDWVLARTTAAKVGRDQDDANARLIAAAPDLLEALKAMVDKFDSEIHNEYDGTSMLKDRLSEANFARLIIAKAEGRAN